MTVDHNADSGSTSDPSAPGAEPGEADGDRASPSVATEEEDIFAGSLIDSPVEATPVVVELDATEPLPEPSSSERPKQRSSSSKYRHDLRTPFNLIIGYSEMLIEDAEDAGDTYFGSSMQNVLTDAKELLGVVDGMLDRKSPIPSQERVNHDLLFPLSHLLQNVDRLRKQSAAHGDGEERLPDLDRIYKAIKLFEELVGNGYIDKATADKRTLSASTSASTSTSTSSPQDHKAKQKPTETGKVLVVDDNESNRNMLSRRLEREGHEVKIAENGRLALDMLREEDFDLVLLDVMMPEMDGYEVLERLHADDRLRGIPVIMISALDELNTVVRCIELGAEDYLSKPFDPVILRARIGACLEKKRLRDRERAYTERLRLEQERSDQLLLNILPRPIAARLKDGQTTIADSFPDVTVLFADLVGFTRMSEQSKPKELVAMLNKIFSMFDLLADKHGLEKIKTIGDEYMAAGGIPVPREDHAEAVAEMALDMLAVMDRFNAKHNHGVRIRIGMNCGPVTAGIIGTRKFAYDLWGDTVNIASRMESHGIANSIQVTEETYKRLRYRFSFQRRGIIHVKGKGALCTYFLVGRRPQPSRA